MFTRVKVASALPARSASCDTCFVAPDLAGSANQSSDDMYQLGMCQYRNAPFYTGNVALDIVEPVNRSMLTGKRSQCLYRFGMHQASTPFINLVAFEAVFRVYLQIVTEVEMVY
ncbi:hypothetical protein GQ457_10G002880 [Hibiscus cannabinus]